MSGKEAGSRAMPAGLAGQYKSCRQTRQQYVQE
jgi:hypothetical protein